MPEDFDTIDCVGIGYTDATEITFTFEDEAESGYQAVRTISISAPAPYHNGLYLIEPIYGIEFYESICKLTITHNGTFIGRIGLGKYRQLNTAVAKEPGFYTTTESAKTLSGQVIPGAGGYSGRSIDLDVRYKIDAEIYDDIEKAYNRTIMRSYPYFILLDDEQHKLPINMYRFYGNTREPLSKLQSSTYRFLYSYKFDFIEAF
jgi:hypothetical protein